MKITMKKQRRRVRPGEYSATVTAAKIDWTINGNPVRVEWTLSTGGRVTELLWLRDSNPIKACTAMQRLRAILAAAGVAPDVRLVGLQAIITIKYETAKDGREWAKVVSYRPIPEGGKR